MEIIDSIAYHIQRAIEALRVGALGDCYRSLWHAQYLILLTERTIERERYA